MNEDYKNKLNSALIWKLYFVLGERPMPGYLQGKSSIKAFTTKSRDSSGDETSCRGRKSTQVSTNGIRKLSLLYENFNPFYIAINNNNGSLRSDRMLINQ
jgi:hypothetical protein